FQNLMQSELFRYFPAQRQALESALGYVDNYLAQASQGVFIGIGLIFLLWTLTSLMSNVEDTFNHVWGITT
ncbi:MAG: YihY/virulence factor BrkB family protein, partial [Muribaculaceae bacterium]|nr:YihY/virulence factor BrkB family protein [Muribaculaceae bacterium]